MVYSEERHGCAPQRRFVCARLGAFVGFGAVAMVIDPRPRKASADLLEKCVLLLFAFPFLKVYIYIYIDVLFSDPNLKNQTNTHKSDSGMDTFGLK